MIDSLQNRLGFATTVVAVLSLIASAVAVDQAFQASERQAMRQRMLAQLYLLLSVARIEPARGLTMPKATELPEPELAITGSGLYAYIGTGNTVLWRSPSILDRALPAPLPVRFGERIWREVELADGKGYTLLAYGFAKTTVDGNFPLNFYLLSERAPLERQIETYRRRLGLGLTGVAVLLVLSQVAVLRWSLRPLRRIADELAAIEAGKIDRIQGRYPAEIRQLTGNLNVLLDQERSRQARYRNALADLAHSLKTPLAVLAGAVEEPESLAANVVEQSARMAGIVERQLQRAAMTGGSAASASAQVFPLVERILSSLEKVYRDKKVTAVNRIAADLLFRGNEADLVEILGNLIDNAYKWCLGAVQVDGRQDGRALTIVVHDDGPGIDGQSLAKIGQRGARADESAPGHGIGLAVVADIVDAYRGQLRFASSLLGGAAVVVEFDG